MHVIDFETDANEYADLLTFIKDSWEGFGMKS